MGKLTREDAIAMGLIQPETESEENRAKRENIERQFHELQAQMQLATIERPRAIICDLDGTLALMTDRKPFDWHLVGNDKPNRPVIDLVKRYAIDHGIFIVSGRSDECRVQTVRWLRQHHIPCLCLFMRKAGDYRKDAEVKREIWEQQIVPLDYRITFCLDDRNQSVEFWRSLGLTCLQVAPGDF